MAVDSLTDEHRAILAIEQRWWATAGGKDKAIAEIGLRPIRYYQLLNRLIDSPAALAHSPVVVNRLRRVRGRRRASSSHG